MTDAMPEAKPEATPDAVASKAPATLPPALDLALRVVGFVVALLLAALSAAFEAFLTPLHWNGTRIPVALVAAVLGNLGLVWFTVTVTGRRLAVAGPALVWVVAMVTAASRTREGDLVLTDNNWVGIGTMLAGSVAFAVVAYRLVLSGTREASRAGSPRP